MYGSVSAEVSATVRKEPTAGRMDLQSKYSASSNSSRARASDVFAMSWPYVGVVHKQLIEIS